MKSSTSVVSSASNFFCFSDAFNYAGRNEMAALNAQSSICAFDAILWDSKVKREWNLTGALRFGVIPAIQETPLDDIFFAEKSKSSLVAHFERIFSDKKPLLLRKITDETQ